MHQRQNLVGPSGFVTLSVATGLVLAATGFVVWTGLSIWGGLGQEIFVLRDAWDTRAYFVVGVPAMVIAVAAAAFHVPERIWRWPLWMVSGHQAGVLFVGLGMQTGLSLVVLTLMIAGLLAAFFAVPALIGSLLARRIGVRAY
jgi:hypothetical protein